MTHVNWRTLKVGMHVKLSCGCEGFVTQVNLDPEAEDPDRGFLLLYTADLISHNPAEREAQREHTRDSYRRGYGPYSNWFNYLMCEDALPIEEVPVPEWWLDIMIPRSRLEDHVRNLLEKLGQMPDPQHLCR